MLVGGGKKRYLMGGLRRNGWMRKKNGEKKSVEWDTCLFMYKNKNHKCVMTQQIITTFFKIVKVSNIHMSKRKF